MVSAVCDRVNYTYRCRVTRSSGIVDMLSCMQLILLSNKLHATTRMERCGPGEHNFVTVVTRFRGVVVHFRSFLTPTHVQSGVPYRTEC